MKEGMSRFSVMHICRSAKKTTYLSALALAGMMASAQAATITWATAAPLGTAPGNSAEVSTNGTLIEAVNAGMDDAVFGSSVTVNGVTFTGSVSGSSASLFGSNYNTGGAHAASGGGNASSDAWLDGNGGDADYNLLVSSNEFFGGTPTTTLTLATGLLDVGAEYEIQVWYADDRDGPKRGRNLELNTTGGTAVSLFGEGNSVIGSFTTDGTSQELQLNATNFGSALISAYQIREITAAVPEPSSTTLLGLGGLALILRRRK